jgi:acyl-[acyl-carrier-protein]-phospholipid O-acyltransferase/long-chain-fatty-acid--[acyl-carrier-protein] ligase
MSEVSATAVPGPLNSNPANPAAPTYGSAPGQLFSPAFLGLTLVQVLGTINDGVFRWLTVPIAVHILAGNDPDKARSSESFLLSIGLVAFTVPYLVLANVAGALADRFAKRSVIIACKIAEVFLAALLVIAILSGNVPFMLATVFMIGAQSALFAPAKFGSIPELLPTERISAGNGLMGLVTVVSAAGGTVLAYWLYEQTKPVGTSNLWITATAVLGIAIVGWLASYFCRSAPAQRPGLPLPINPFSGLTAQLRELITRKKLFRASLGVMFFWSLASLVQMTVVSLTDELGVPKSASGELLAIVVLGVGSGSVLAAWMSRDRVELGIVPLAATGIVIFSIAIYVLTLGMTADQPRAVAATWRWLEALLFLQGACAGAFNVPLDSFLQDRSPPEKRGEILSASNFLTFTGILCCAGLFYLLKDVLQLSARQVFLLTGLASLPVAAYVWWFLPKHWVRVLFGMVLGTVYRVRVHGLEHLPRTGGVVLAPNHVTWVDGFILSFFIPRDIRFIAFAGNIERGIGKWISDLFGTIPINNTEGPKALVKSLQFAKAALRDGDCICIFAEGTLTRSGQVQPFQRGLVKIIDGVDVPVLPMYLDGLWGSIFSFRDGRFFKKWPRKWPYPVDIHIGPPLRKVTDIALVREGVDELGIAAARTRKDRDMIPPQKFLRACRQKWSQPKLADSSGEAISGKDVLIRTLVLRRLLGRQLGTDEQMVGVLLPPSIGGCLVNAALPLMGKIAINLNYTATPATLNACIAQTKIRHVLTSRKFIEKVKFELDAPYVFLEDLKPTVTLPDKLIAAGMATLAPVTFLDRYCGLHKQSPDDLLTIIFTSGSTGVPKGVMLSHSNVASNLEAIDGLFQLKPTDAFLGILPFFHSTGFTATLWTVLTLQPQGVYHYNPLDARVIGDLVQKHQVTIVITTPTFLRTYYKRCDKEQLASLKLLIVGAEKLPQDLALAVQEKFGVFPTEGYGATETSPLAAVNVPDYRSTDVTQVGNKPGTVGRAIPHTRVRVIDPDTGEVLGLDQPGVLCVKGPNVMKGYYNQPELTAKVINDGWYSTGDIAKIDADGFITITDRQSRFSKIGGEMVPHLSIEEKLVAILRAGDEDQELKAVVTSVPCEKKGERLIVLHKPLDRPVDDVHKALEDSGLPNLWLPSRDAYYEVQDIPVLGTGKVDLRGMKKLALDLTGQAS